MPRRPRRPRAARMRPEERRAQLLACAVGAFARHGFAATRHADVAADAGVSLPAVFVYFPTRDALTTAVLDEVERYYGAMLRTAHERDGEARDVLGAVAAAFAASVDTDPTYARVWLDWSTTTREAPWRRYVAFQRRVLRDLATTIRGGQRAGTVTATLDAADAARLMYAAAYAVLQMKLGGEPAARVARFLHRVVDAVAPPAARGSGRDPRLR